MEYKALLPNINEVSLENAMLMKNTLDIKNNRYIILQTSSSSLFRRQQAKHAIQQGNKFHKGRQPKRQMPITLANYSTSRIIETS